MDQLDRVTSKLRKDLEHKCNRGLDFNEIVNPLRSKRENDRYEFAFAQLEKERAHCSPREELMEVFQDIARRRGAIYDSQTQDEIQHCEHKYLWRCLIARAFFARRSPVLVV